ncbi:MAG: hypothetical protein O8C66_03365 [Candidatus Methanoperedens sp.]|nr:hypothetical protein [Candidatus Methanoperedens sp.]MCZ7369526.1 hypothetical protein [Candidatus Methanoperedens sp.]
MKKENITSRIQYVILVIFFIFLTNTASAIEHNYVSLTLTPGEELTQTTSFTGAYKRLFAAADASGNAASWATPRRIDFGPIDPGERIEREYTISVPRSQKPGYYELIWKYSCKYTDGTTCTSISDTVLQITVEVESAPTTSPSEYKSLTVAQGDELNDYLSFSARSDEHGLYAWADASGNAASWVTPRRIDFGEIGPGENPQKYYTIRAPINQEPGYYDLIWTWGCGYQTGETCKPVTGVTVLKIIVEAKGRPAFTPVQESSTDPIIMAFSFSLILFIIWIYIIIWIVRDANKRGKSGILWGIAAFFLFLVGLLIYLIARPKANLELCKYCGKEKLETLTQCPHCKKSTTSAFIPTPAPMPVPHPAIPEKPQGTIDELKKQKEKLNKINALLEKLDEKLAQGEITEARYTELSEQYGNEAEKLKNMITEKELMKEVGL